MQWDLIGVKCFMTNSCYHSWLIIIHILNRVRLWITPTVSSLDVWLCVLTIVLNICSLHILNSNAASDKNCHTLASRDKLGMYFKCVNGCILILRPFSTLCTPIFGKWLMRTVIDIKKWFQSRLLSWNGWMSIPLSVQNNDLCHINANQIFCVACGQWLELACSHMTYIFALPCKLTALRDFQNNWRLTEACQCIKSH